MSEAAASATAASAESATAESADRRTGFEPTQEIRFALVLYGGVSLAIYINGVVQEFLSLVQATAPDTPTECVPTQALLGDTDLRGTQRVYRRLGQMLSFDSQLEPEPPRPAPESPISTRFIVDVISGSSAGGINGIFLGKALANEQSIDQLRALWVDEGDIAKLINDGGSYGEVGSLGPASGPTQSLLNGRRMYWKLLSALDGLDGIPAVKGSRLVDELDVWITTTDLRGLLLPIDLSDAVVFEPRHRNVLNFRYASGAANSLRCHDFHRELNPLLAFAARSTSSFPFAFEPTALADVDEFLSLPEFANYANSSSRSPLFQPFFADYVSARKRTGDGFDAADYYRSDAFADGGYLDNKPFGWALESIRGRRADLPVQRRLIYVEPSPSRTQPAVPHSVSLAAENPLAPPAWRPPAAKPNALENSMAAAYGLPRTESIRDDIDQILRRNRDLARVRDITRLVDGAADAAWVGNSPGWRPRRTLDEWLRLKADELVKDFGPQYAAYHRLKIAAVLDALADCATAMLDYPAQGNERDALRLLLEAWFLWRYSERWPCWPTQTRFLFEFDLGYRLRRLRYVNHRLDGLIRLDRTTASEDHGTEDQPLTAFLAHFAGEREVAPITDTEQAQFRTELRGLKRDLNAIRAHLLKAEQEMRPRGEEHQPLAQALESAGVTRTRLLQLLDGPESPSRRLDSANRLLNVSGVRPAIVAFAQAVADQLDPSIGSAGREAEARVREDEPALDPQAQLARSAIHFIYREFENYDMVSFPISYGVVEEASQVDVVRISPQDATSLIDESSASDGRHKLAGDQFGHFGGFLDRAWRRNDLLWGRLDAAERIIETLMRPSEARDQMLEEAQLAIIEEEFELAEQEPLVVALAASMLTDEHGAQDSLSRLVRDRGSDALVQALTSSLDATAIREHLKTDYEFDRAIDNKRLLGVAGRATRVTGEILEGLSDRASALKAPSRWFVRIGRFAWWLAEIATPRSLKQVLFNYWFALLLLTSVLMIIGGGLIGWPAATNGGWLLLLVLAAARLITWVSRDLLQRNLGLFALLGLLAVVAVSILAGIELFAHASDDIDQLRDRLPSWAAIEDATQPDAAELRLFAAIGFAAAAAGAVIGWLFSRGSEHPNLLELQFIRDRAHLESLVGLATDQRRNGTRRLLHIDFGFIALYTAIFISLAVLLALGNTSWLTIVAAIALAGTIATGLADVLENLATLKLLRIHLLAISRKDIARVRQATTAKWSGLAVVVAALSFLFWGRDRDRLMAAYEIAWLLAAVVGAVGVSGFHRLRLVRCFYLLTSLVVAATLVLFLVAPDRFLTGFR